MDEEPDLDPKPQFTAELLFDLEELFPDLAGTWVIHNECSCCYNDDNEEWIAENPDAQCLCHLENLECECEACEAGRAYADLHFDYVTGRWKA